MVCTHSRIILQLLNTSVQGIAGGFAPPTPSAVHTVTAAQTLPHLIINSAVRPNGTPSLKDAGAKSLTNDAETCNLVDELYGILKTIPMEFPPGSEDIYGMDTSIAWGSDDLQWMNGGPQGCGGGKSQKQANDEEKAKFKRAVEIVNHLVGKAA
jgi:hypothetical protein